MKFSNIFEKLGILFNLIIDSNVFTILLISIIAIFLLKLSNKINNKKTGIIIYVIELLALCFVIYEGKEVLANVSNKIIDNIFLNFYFPSVYVYLFIYITSIVVFIYTILNRLISKTYKTITNTYFFILNFIFIILVNVIAKNNIDVFEKTSLFTNNDALVLLELSTLLFFIYIITMSLVYFTNSVILLVEAKKSNIGKYNNNLELTNPILNTNNIISNEQYNYSNKTAVSFQKLVENINLNEKQKIELVPEIKNYNKTNMDSTETKTEYKFVDPTLLAQPFANEVITTNVEQALEEKLNFIDFNIIENKKDDKLTLNDYKLFSNMLKTVIRNNNNANLSMTDLLDKALLSKYSFEDYQKFEKILNSCMN